MEKTHIILFGGTGDLARNKLIPALFEIYKKNKQIDVFGVGRRELSTNEFVQTFNDPANTEMWEEFKSQITYIQGSFTDKQLYETIRSHLTSENVLFYLAVDPSSFPIIINLIKESQLNFPSSRIIIEKPFGNDKESAYALYQEVNKVFHENQVFIIDHYLGKETIQNILAFRFANSIFEHLWNREFVDSIQISVSESAGTSGRGGYYDQAGAIKDMLQSHILQILAAICMEPPETFNPQEVSQSRTNLISSLEHFDQVPESELASRIVFGQYDGYQNEEKVAPQSSTETFLSLKTFIHNYRWREVPIYLRTGKKLPLRTTEVYIIFKNPKHNLFINDQSKINMLAFRIQPNEGISLRLFLKEPGEGVQLKPVSMDFCYQDSFAVSDNSHIRLLEDAIVNNKTLFTSIDEIIASWNFVEPIEQYRIANPAMVRPYTSGTWGPEDATTLIAKDGRSWQTLYPYKCDINMMIYNKDKAK